ncbi:MAG: T9SS type A sorting domain-containing protein, partial [Bacteroidetes bacterium]|nr:T9SS type A sorting domain-containing protein [Bacteroidota bacterium]
VYVGAGGFSAWQANNTTIVIDSQGIPYVAYADRANDYKATVMKFDGSNWIPVGSPGLTPGIAEYPFLTIDNNDVLYLVFQDFANSKKASVMKFDGVSWVTVGSPGFSADEAMYTTMAIDNNTGTMYAAYENVYNSTTLSPTCNATVMKFDITTGVRSETGSSMIIYPNPANGLITLNTTGLNGKYILNVSNSLGKSVYTENVNIDLAQSVKQIELGHLSKGIYFVELQTADKARSKQVKKLVIQ